LAGDWDGGEVEVEVEEDGDSAKSPTNILGCHCEEAVFATKQSPAYIGGGCFAEFILRYRRARNGTFLATSSRTTRMLLGSTIVDIEEGGEQDARL
jgi:hypothetical protein